MNKNDHVFCICRLIYSLPNQNIPTAISRLFSVTWQPNKKIMALNYFHLVAPFQRKTQNINSRYENWSKNRDNKIKKIKPENKEMTYPPKSACLDKHLYFPYPSTFYQNDRMYCVLISLRCSLGARLDPLQPFKAHSADSGQTGRMSRFSWVFAWRTCRFVCFVGAQLNMIDKIDIMEMFNEDIADLSAYLAWKW